MVSSRVTLRTPKPKGRDVAYLVPEALMPFWHLMTMLRLLAPVTRLKLCVTFDSTQRRNSMPSTRDISIPSRSFWSLFYLSYHP